MRQGAADTWFVFGLPWWPFDGSAIAALIALLGTLATIGFAWRKFHVAERNQDERHEQTVASTERLGERGLLNRDMQRAEEALAGNDANHWVHAGVILREVHLSEYATDADRRRARAVMRAFKERVTPAV